jgi:hypothetical protein
MTDHLARFHPADGVEFGFIEEMVATWWRLRRAWSIETQLLNDCFDFTQPGDGTSLLAAAFKSPDDSHGLALLHRYETRLHNMYHRAPKNLLMLQTTRAPNEPNPISEHQSPDPGLPATDPQPPEPDPPAPPTPAATPDRAAPNEPNPISEHQSPDPRPAPPAPGPYLPIPDPRPPLRMRYTARSLCRNPTR